MDSEGRFHNGRKWTNVQSRSLDDFEEKKRPQSSVRSLSKPDEVPVFPVVGDGNILVTIPSFRDGKRCGQAVFDLFQRAKDADKIVVNLVEQNHEGIDDPFCLEVYCKLVTEEDIYKRVEIRKDTIKVMLKADVRSKCPRNDQIRVVKVGDLFAKGPQYARALGRKNLADEEFCLQTNAYGSFVENWDEKVIQEWLMTENEYAIISNPLKKKSEEQPTPDQIVPRNCAITFSEPEGLPIYHHADGKVDSLVRPLLSHTWSPSFSFAKCHLEESTPYDSFLPYVSSNIEAFGRYARAWTRGYDFYTPTRIIIYSNDYGNNSNPRNDEWINKRKNRKSRALSKSLRRIRSYLEISKDEESVGILDNSNLGIYGIGKRRTLKQLEAFAGINLKLLENRPKDLPCGNFEWVPYNSMISPIENLYSERRDNLDPQPIFSLRHSTFTETHDNDLSNNFASEESSSLLTPTNQFQVDDTIPYTTILFLWLLGLFLWFYYTFVSKFGALYSLRMDRAKSDKNK